MTVKKIVKKKTKKRQIKIMRDKKGRFIRLKNKKVYINDDISERQLLKFVISTLSKAKGSKQSKRSKDTKTEKAVGSKKTIDPITSSVSYILGQKAAQQEKGIDAFRQLKNETIQQQLLPAVTKLAITDGKEPSKPVSTSAPPLAKRFFLCGLNSIDVTGTPL